MTVFYLAYRYIQFHRLRTLLLLAALALTFFLPLATRWTMQQIRQQALLRADATPMLIGTKGSSVGLTLHALYYRGDAPSSINYSQLERLDSLKLAQSLPLFTRFRTRGHTIVGTTNDYLAFRDVKLSSGEPLADWGDCLVGSSAARELGVSVGDSLLSEPENMLDLSGPAPLRLRIRGILARSGSSDDDVIFCHLETTWIMAGIGHGHSVPAVTEQPSGSDDPSEPSESLHPHQVENLQRYSEITPENRNSFHFHGRRADYPLTAIIAVPDSQRSATLLEGKYLSPDEPCQVVIPSQVIGDLLQLVARVQQLLDAVSLLLGLATVCLVAVVMLLSLRLRAAEIHTLKLLGASRWKIAQIMSAELALITATSLVLALALAYFLSPIFCQMI